MLRVRVGMVARTISITSDISKQDGHGRTDSSEARANVNGVVKVREKSSWRGSRSGENR